MIWRALHEYVNFVHGPEKQYRSSLPRTGLIYGRCGAQKKHVILRSLIDRVQLPLMAGVKGFGLQRARTTIAYVRCHQPARPAGAEEEMREGEDCGALVIYIYIRR